MTIYDGELIIAGTFHVAGGIVSNYWVRWAVPEVYIGDLNHDCQLDFYDLSLFCEQWLRCDCEAAGFCYETDMDYNRRVDLADYARLVHSLTYGNCFPPYVGDMDYDCDVDFFDVEFLASRWLNYECSQSKWCDGADKNRNNEVELGDFSIVARRWLAGTDID
jgi:hypothetical protein